MLQNGYEMLTDVIDLTSMNDIKKDLDLVAQGQNFAGIRNAEKKMKSIDRFVHSDALKGIVQRYLKGEPKLVRVIAFNKTAEHNWYLSWHQDKTVSVSQKFEGVDWDCWSIKEGGYHVQPPLEVLEKMVTLRVHLDDTGIENGCLKVIPKSHELGIVSQPEISAVAKTRKSVDCILNAGDAVVMRPHIIHASGKVQAEGQRRVIHIEFSCYELPEGVLWS